MEEYQNLGKVDFEAKWSADNGELIHSHQIIRQLRTRSRNRNEELAATVRLDFPGDKFTKYFSYRKNGGIFVLKDANSIAKRYSALRMQHPYAGATTPA